MREKNHARLQARHEELAASIDREVKEVEQTAAEARGAVWSWWSDTRASLERQLEVMRTDFNKRRPQLVEKDAERPAQPAEPHAVAAITLASHCVDAAELAVIRANSSVLKPASEAEQLGGDNGPPRIAGRRVEYARLRLKGLMLFSTHSTAVRPASNS
jgi:hypothetical protein